MNSTETPNEILERVFNLLAHGVKNRHDAFHTAVLATVNQQNLPEARTVVFRRFERELRFALFCHVDRRSPKAAEIENNPQVSWLFYHSPERIQLRCRGTAVIHTNDETADAQWQSSQLFSRRCYCGAAPGTPADTPSSGLPEFLENRSPTLEETEEMGRQNFAVIETAISEMDVYELNVRGHRRSLFVFNENGEIELRWLTP